MPKWLGGRAVGSLLHNLYIATEDCTDRFRPFFGIEPVGPPGDFATAVEAYARRLGLF